MLKFREATLDDLSTLKAFEQRVVDAERPFNTVIKEKDAFYYDIPSLISGDNALMLVVEDNGNIIATGYVQIRESKPSLSHQFHGYLGFMFVDEHYRGQGLNKAVLDKLMDWAKDEGISDFYLDVYSTNESAIKAYQKAGFEPSLLEMKLHSD